MDAGAWDKVAKRYGHEGVETGEREDDGRGDECCFGVGGTTVEEEEDEEEKARVGVVSDELARRKTLDIWEGKW